MRKTFLGLLTVGSGGLLVAGCGGLLDGGGCAAADCGGDLGPSSGGTMGFGAKAGSGSAHPGGSTGLGGLSGETGGAGGASTGGKGGAGGTTGGTGGSTGGAAGQAGGTGGSAGSSLDACTWASDCVVMATSCCGSCNPTADQLIAINHESVNTYVGERTCTDVLCEECDPEGLPAAAWFGTTCEGGHCVLFDARETALTECEVSDDCTLRNGLTCCEACSATVASVVAINPSAEVADLLCGAPISCPPCVPTIPDGLAPTCVGGRCRTVPPPRLPTR